MAIEKKTLRSDIPGHQHMMSAAMPYGAQAEENRRMTVGRDISFSGEIRDCAHLVIEGRVAAETLSVGRLDIAETGALTGTITVQDAAIFGRFEGKMTVQGRLTLRAGSVVSGEIEYGEIEAEAGCVLNARLSRLQGAVDAAPKKTSEIRKTEARGAVSPVSGKNVEKLFNGMTEEPAAGEKPGTFRRAAGY